MKNFCAQHPFVLLLLIWADIQNKTHSCSSTSQSLGSVCVSWVSFAACIYKKCCLLPKIHIYFRFCSWVNSGSNHFLTAVKQDGDHIAQTLSPWLFYSSTADCDCCPPKHLHREWNHTRVQFEWTECCICESILRPWPIFPTKDMFSYWRPQSTTLSLCKGHLSSAENLNAVVKENNESCPCT